MEDIKFPPLEGNDVRRVALFSLVDRDRLTNARVRRQAAQDQQRREQMAAQEQQRQHMLRQILTAEAAARRECHNSRVVFRGFFVCVANKVVRSAHAVVGEAGQGQRRREFVDQNGGKQTTQWCVKRGRVNRLSLKHRALRQG